MSDFLVVLVGVVLGGAITMGSSLVLERRREDRQAARDATREDRQLRQAARLIYQELGEAIWLIERAVDDYRWWPHPSRTFPTRRWHEFGPTLAGSNELPQGSWLLVTFAYEDLQDFEAKLDAFYRAAELPSFGVKQDRELRQLWEVVNEGREAIADAAEAEPRPGFDAVAAMHNAAKLAAIELMPAPDLPTADADSYRADLTARLACRLTGVALMNAPDWKEFEVEIEQGTLLEARMHDIPGSSARHLSVLGDRKGNRALAKRFVPPEIRGDRHYSDFAFIVDRQDFRSWFEEQVFDS